MSCVLDPVSDEDTKYKVLVSERSHDRRLMQVKRLLKKFHTESLDSPYTVLTRTVLTLIVKGKVSVNVD